MNQKALISLALLGTALGGCTTLGTNVAGSFRCSAPDGVCAPSSVIDDSALARIEETIEKLSFAVKYSSSLIYIHSIFLKAWGAYPNAAKP